MSCVGDRGLWLFGIGRPFSDLPSRAVVSPGSGHGSEAGRCIDGGLGSFSEYPVRPECVCGLTLE